MSSISFLRFASEPEFLNLKSLADAKTLHNCDGWRRIEIVPALVIDGYVTLSLSPLAVICGLLFF